MSKEDAERAAECLRSKHHQSYSGRTYTLGYAVDGPHPITDTGITPV